MVSGLSLLLLEQIPDALIATTNSGEVLMWNHAAHSLFGYAAEETLGRNIQGFLKSPHTTENPFSASNLDGAEFILQRRDNALLRVSVSACPFKDSSQEEQGVIFRLCDYTRPSIERDVRLLEESYKDLLETMPDAIVIINELGYIVLINGQTEALFGYLRQELVGQPVEILIPPRYRDKHPHHRNAFFHNPKVRPISSNQELRGQHKDGSEFPVEISLSPIKRQEGMLVIGSIRDMTERKRSEYELHEKKQVLEMVMNQVPLAIFWKDRHSVITGCNHRFALDAGLSSPGEIIGKTDFDMPWKDQAPLYQADDAHVMAHDEPRLFIEEPLENGDGSHRWLRSSKLPLHDPHGHVVGVLGSYEDVTDRKEAEAEIIRARNAADEASRAKSEFLSRMSHELRTPLNAILGFGQILELEPLDENSQEAVYHILKSGRHLLDLINEILDIARIEAGRLSISLEKVLVSEMVKAVLDMMQPVAAGRTVQLIYQDEIRDASVLADNQRLRQVLINLVSNAVKYNRDGGTVVISCTPVDDEKLRINIIDTGPGLSKEEISRLFIPFERLKAAESPVEGTGIGLALSRRLMEAMNGVVGVESVVGKGSTFWIELPTVQDEQEHPKIEENESSQRTLIGKNELCGTVLYIEDNISNLRLIENLMRRMPAIKLLSAMQGRIGIELAKQHRPDLILLDIHLPDISGEEVLRRIRAEPEIASIPVIVLSADATRSQIERIKEARVSDYLTKPLDITLFFEALKQTLGKGSVA